MISSVVIGTSPRCCACAGSVVRRGEAFAAPSAFAGGRRPADTDIFSVEVDIGIWHQSGLLPNGHGNGDLALGRNPHGGSRKKCRQRRQHLRNLRGAIQGSVVRGLSPRGTKSARIGDATSKLNACRRNA